MTGRFQGRMLRQSGWGPGASQRSDDPAGPCQSRLQRAQAARTLWRWRDIDAADEWACDITDVGKLRFRGRRDNKLNAIWRHDEKVSIGACCVSTGGLWPGKGWRRQGRV